SNYTIFPFFLTIIHFDTIENYEKHIYKGSWASWITVIKGCKVVYSTKEFKEFRKRLRRKPISKENLIKLIKYKEKRIKNYQKLRGKGFSLTKGLMGSLRLRLQLLTFLMYKQIIFDYSKCVKKIRLEKEEKEMLKKLHKYYDKREKLTQSEFEYYRDLALKFDEKILGLLN
ncbi:hypothetical protein ACFL0X_02865, partial [Nanoarchaeota archaeon]